jgi:hypothetical protein
VAADRFEADAALTAKVRRRPAFVVLLGREASGARLAALVVDERRVRWMDPGTEGNRLGYQRVTRSRLRLRLSSGAEASSS